MLVARHPNRPTVLDYVSRLFTEFTEISGDRRFADDHAIVTGFARTRTSRSCGRPPQGRRRHEAEDLPELRLCQAGGLPQGAARDEAGGEVSARRSSRSSTRRPRIPGIESEERGISEAIAVNLREMAALDTPIIVVVHGEGGSGGALGLAVGDRILMHEFAIYSVIPPEGCAAILWRDSGRKVEAAEALKLTAPDLLRLGLIDEIVPEPAGGSHTNHDLAAALLDTALGRALSEVSAMDPRRAWKRAIRSGERWGTWGSRK